MHWWRGIITATYNQLLKYGYITDIFTLHHSTLAIHYRDEVTRLISAQVILSHWHLTLSHRACLRRATTRLTEGKVFQNSSSACLRMNGAYNVRELFVESVLLQLFLLTYQEALQVKWFFLNLARKNWKLMYFLSFLSALEQAWKKKNRVLRNFTSNQIMFISFKAIYCSYI